MKILKNEDHYYVGPEWTRYYIVDYFNSLSDWPAISEWCADNFQGRYECSGIICAELESDVLLFKLRWS